MVVISAFIIQLTTYKIVQMIESQVRAQVIEITTYVTQRNPHVYMQVALGHCGSAVWPRLDPPLCYAIMVEICIEKCLIDI